MNSDGRINVLWYKKTNKQTNSKTLSTSQASVSALRCFSFFSHATHTQVTHNTVQKAKIDFLSSQPPCSPPCPDQPDSTPAPCRLGSNLPPPFEPSARQPMVSLRENADAALSFTPPL